MSRTNMHQFYKKTNACIKEINRAKTKRATDLKKKKSAIATLDKIITNTRKRKDNLYDSTCMRYLQ